MTTAVKVFQLLLLLSMISNGVRKICYALNSKALIRPLRSLSTAINPSALYASRSSYGNRKNSNRNVGRATEKDTVDESALNAIKPSLTGRTVELSWKEVGIKPDERDDSQVVTRTSEMEMLPVLVKRGEFVSSCDLSALREEEILAMCEKTGFSIRQAMSLRKQLLVGEYLRIVMEDYFTSW